MILMRYFFNPSIKSKNVLFHWKVSFQLRSKILLKQKKPWVSDVVYMKKKYVMNYLILVQFCRRVYVVL